MDQDKARMIPRSQLIDDKILAFEVMLAEVCSFDHFILKQ